MKLNFVHPSVVCCCHVESILYVRRSQHWHTHVKRSLTETTLSVFLHVCLLHFICGLSLQRMLHYFFYCVFPHIWWAQWKHRECFYLSLSNFVQAKLQCITSQQQHNSGSKRGRHDANCNGSPTYTLEQISIGGCM